MTDRERILKLLGGDEPDRQPVISWPCAKHAETSIIVRPPNQPLINPSTASAGGGSVSSGEPGRGCDGLVLAEIVNPFGIAIEQGRDLNALLKTDPERGATELDRLTSEVKASILDVIERGADGILYRLHGACAKWCSPMQYGGFYLERDRELMEAAQPLMFNVLFVAGDEEVYFDFVSDLPAQALGWDSRMTGVTAKQMRGIREGLLLAEDEEADIRLAAQEGSIAEGLERVKANV